ncbi:MAG: hypothetical protein WDZ43_04770 [Nitrosopumilaceae archaeon]
MKQKKVIPIIVIVVAAIVSVIYVYDIQKSSDENKSQWIISGPFAIDKPKYKLGENVFLTVHGLKPNEAGNIVIVSPHEVIWTTLPFNGTLKTDFNYYFKPETSRALKIYNPEDLVGTWKVVFQGLTYQPLHFEIANEFLPGAESDIKPIPRPNETKTIGPMQQ